MILDEEIKIQWSYRMKSFYINKGYTFTHIGDTLIINARDLNKNSPIKVSCKCDFCGKIFKRARNKIDSSKPHSCGDNQCKQAIRKITSLNKYGVEHPTKTNEVKNKMQITMIERYNAINPSQVPQFHNKAMQTIKERYGKNENPKGYKRRLEKIQNTYKQKTGYDNPWKNPEVQDKIKQTNKNKYGYEYFNQTKEAREHLRQIKISYSDERKQEIKSKRIQTNLKKYGAENVWGSEYGKQKIKETNLKRYGVENVMHNPQILKKLNDKLRLNGYVSSSTQQRYLCKLLNGTLNYNLHNVFLDIALVNEKIDIEYDGSGHFLGVKLHKISLEEAKRQELERENFIINNGFKIIRIISMKHDKLFSDDKIIELINICKQHLINNDCIRINIDELKITSNNFNCLLDKEGNIM